MCAVVSETRKNLFFYQFLRSFALICKLVGHFPLQNVTQRDGRLLRHRWLSVDTLWTPLIYGVWFFFLMTLHGVRRWLRLSSYVQWSLTGAFVVIGVFSDRLLPVIIGDIEAFDDEYCRIYGHFGYDFEKKLGRAASFVSVSTVTLFLTFSLIGKPESDSIVTDVLQVFRLLPRQMTVYMYLVLTASITRRFWRLTLPKIKDTPKTDHSVNISDQKQNRCFILTGQFKEFCVSFTNFSEGSRSNTQRQTLFTVTTSRSISQKITDRAVGDQARSVPNPVKLEEARLLHGKLCDIVRSVENCFGERIAFYLAMLMFEILYDLYQYLYMDSFQTTQQLFFNAFNVISVVCIALVSDQLSVSVSINELTNTTRKL